MTTSMKRIHSVTIKRMMDDSPDTSHLGEYSNICTSKFSIDRQHALDCATQYDLNDAKTCDCSGGDWQRGEYRFFNPSFNYVNENGKPTDGNTPAEVRKYTVQDYERMESLNAGNWHYIGLRAEAEVQLTKDGPLQGISSGGLWGVESDSGKDYLAEVEQEELSQLREQLHALGFSKRAIAAAFRNIERADD